ncbi:unnamed protein product [Moneuplotes crassus]|uniref:Palmitoyltransferase n=1 Tax=Euplotes crassus TaxID=5936 RepID=A0AAD1XE05_EUPCR|nr:unnamed protein product [Moneuplotes crassus]
MVYRYQPYTANVFKRCERGAPFLGVTTMFMAVFVHTSAFLLPDIFEYEGSGIGVFIAVLTYTIMAFAYYCYLKVVFTNPGNIRAEWIHPLNEREQSHIHIDSDEISNANNENIDHEYQKILNGFKLNSTNVPEESLCQNRILAVTQTENGARSEFGNNGQQEREANENIDHMRIVIKNFKYRYCQVCKRDKAPRSHHCRTCNHCVLRMDHHCPWLGSCIGRNNHKHFILFNFYTTIGMIYMATIWALCIFYWDFDYSSSRKLVTYLPLMIIFAINSVSTLSLFACHIVFAFLNITTLETYDAFWTRPFHTGSYWYNFKTVFGDPKWKILWFLPTNPDFGAKKGNQARGDGHIYYYQTAQR